MARLDLSTSVLGVPLALPLMNAAGVFATPRELEGLLDARLGAIVLPTATVHPFVHAEFRSLHNPGYDKLAPLARQLRERGAPPIVAAIAGGTPEEYAHLARAFADAGASLIEADVADPWIAATLGPLDDLAVLGAIAAALAAASPVPALIRLPPGRMRQYPAIAATLREAGVRGVVLRNEFTGVEKFLLAAGPGFEAVAVGGAASGLDLHRALTKGVRAVQVDAASAREGREVFARLERELRLARAERA